MHSGVDQAGRVGLSTGDASDPGARPTSSSVPVSTSTQPTLLPQPGFRTPVSVDWGGEHVGQFSPLDSTIFLL